jgi:hypothetical protein
MRPELLPDNWILHHDNLPSHTALAIKEFWLKKLIVVLEHPTHSPSITSWDFFLFPTTKNHLKGSYFEAVEEIQKVVMVILNSLQLNVFRNCSDSWQQHWNSFVAAGGTYFEGDCCNLE